jgi:membrane peptidoglycan carboxypeptidase
MEEAHKKQQASTRFRVGSTIIQQIEKNVFFGKSKIILAGGIILF